MSAPPDELDAFRTGGNETLLPSSTGNVMVRNHLISKRRLFFIAETVLKTIGAFWSMRPWILLLLILSVPLLFLYELGSLPLSVLEPIEVHYLATAKMYRTLPSPLRLASKTQCNTPNISQKYFA